MQEKKTAIVIGAGGQDGRLLCEHLIGLDYEVHGVFGGSVQLTGSTGLASAKTIRLPQATSIDELVRRIRPTEIYYLAAHHFSSETTNNSHDDLGDFLAVNALSLWDLLKSGLTHVRDVRIFYAASAQVFGRPDQCPQNELTRRQPTTPYGISKSAGMDVCRHFRENYGLFAAVGILYNHESHLRPADFLSSKVIAAAAQAARGCKAPLELADLDAVVDWGAAEDYVVAMRDILQQSEADEFIIATGQGRTVREFVNTAFDCVGIPWEGLVTERPGKRAIERLPYVGDSSRLARIARWHPRVSFEDMVSRILRWHLEQGSSTTAAELR